MHLITMRQPLAILYCAVLPVPVHKVKIVVLLNVLAEYTLNQTCTLYVCVCVRLANSVRFTNDCTLHSKHTMFGVKFTPQN